ncbi:unnamed protein product [Polarella glacialis]|uniref:monoamine oxidase n=1 Tax=Polarella glacialis TaxID=89957 RepID=A0A813HAU8_POLGL|nr:unnamed protein product [Polarella glacialis]
MAAAHRLLALGRSVQILEATDHVGGRTRNVDVSTGQLDAVTDDVIELGGTWLSPEHSAALALCRELGIAVYNASFVSSGSAVPEDAPRPHTSCSEEAWPWWFWGSDYPKDQTHLLKNTVFHDGVRRFLFRTPSELLAGLTRSSVQELQMAGKAIDDAIANVSDSCWDAGEVTASWRHLDEESTWSFLNGKLSSQASKQALRNCIHNKNAQEPEAVSLLYNLLSFKGCNSAGPDSQFRVRGGTQAIPMTIAAGMRDKIALGSPVQMLQSGSTGIIARTLNGTEYRARAAIVTGPPPAILGINFDPPLRAPDAQLLQRMPMGTSLKIAAVYRQGPWWRELGLQGDILATALPKEFSLPEPDSEMPLFVQCLDHSPFSQRLGVIVCFMEGRQNLHFMSLAAQEQQSLLTAFLKRSFNDSRAETFQPSFVALNWADQPYARGAYTGFFPPGVLSIPEYWEAFREMEKAPNVFLAGADYHRGFGNGYIEGAIRDGLLAAERAHARLLSSQVGQELLV